MISQGNIAYTIMQTSILGKLVAETLPVTTILIYFMSVTHESLAAFTPQYATTRRARIPTFEPLLWPLPLRLSSLPPAYDLRASPSLGHRTRTQSNTQVSPFYPKPITPMSTLLSRYKISQMILVPSLVLQLVNHPNIRNVDLSSLQSIGSGAAHLSRDLFDKAASIMPKGAGIFQGIFNH